MAKIPQILFPNPVSPNNKLSNKHCFYVATSEGGKTSAVKNMPKEMRMLPTHSYAFFDPFGDYEGSFKGAAVKHYSKRNEFYAALLKAISLKRPFRIAYKPEQISSDKMDEFCGMVWSVGNGKRPLHVIIEEVAQFVSSNGNATGYLNNLISVGRKFGFMLSFMFQRGQAIPKTLIANCAYKWVGMQEREKDCYYLSDETGIPVAEIIKLEKLQYIFKSPGARNNYVTGKISFKK